MFGKSSIPDRPGSHAQSPSSPIPIAPRTHALSRRWGIRGKFGVGSSELRNRLKAGDRRGEISIVEPAPTVGQLADALALVGRLIAGVDARQWSAPTPCGDWNVRRLIEHLVGLNLVFVALLNAQEMPAREGDRLGEDPVAAYQESANALLEAFSRPDLLTESFTGPLGTVTGSDRLDIRLYDLLVHGWDLAKATGQPIVVPEALARRALRFAQLQVDSQPRTGRFDPAQAVGEDAPAIDQLAAFLGRSPNAA
jgi:uncharacterized protein (TIGR03086 family)